MKVLLAGGGTGGHINPALAIAGIIRDHVPDAEFLFAGTPNHMEARLVPQAGYKIEFIKVEGFQRKISLENIGRNAKALWYLAGSGPRAKQIIREFSPDIAVGTGGYVAGPVIRMAAKMGIPTAIHEQNAYPGVTNKLLAKEVDHVMLTVEDALKYFEEGIPYTVTGLPVRKELFRKTKEEARRELGFDDAFTILSFGGSLGAGCINDTMAEVLRWHTSKGLPINHIHGYGGMGKDTFPQKMQEYGIPMKSSRIRITEYINDMDTCMAAADLVVCRSGANALAELEAMGKPSILIPSPIVAGNHQYHNAMVLGIDCAAHVIEQKNVTGEDMIARIEKLYQSPDKIISMAVAASNLAVRDTEDRIWSVIEKLTAKK
ncbi:MAG: undecaprenyldiphospho-muramoylpentapeptide beta-N-acetylglucosaminyltransferase [Oscillospiraceae bacterium]|nr:undecaprenyldiphospho-muramoylpentapeptide beta-N-acetylglucosaminyltransferase [Oscillospiraceae bacterium]